MASGLSLIRAFSAFWKIQGQWFVYWGYLELADKIEQEFQETIWTPLQKSPKIQQNKRDLLTCTTPLLGFCRKVRAWPERQYRQRRTECTHSVFNVPKGKAQDLQANGSQLSTIKSFQNHFNDSGTSRVTDVQSLSRFCRRTAISAKLKALQKCILRLTAWK